MWGGLLWMGLTDGSPDLIGLVASASLTLLLPNSEIAMSALKEGAHCGPKLKRMRSRRSEIRMY